MPRENVELFREALKEGRDLQMEKAVEVGRVFQPC